MAIDEEKKSFIEKIIILWSAPITKFYLSFEAYLIFLVFFTLAVMWPSCGNLFLDCIVWIWAAAIAFENIRVGYIKYCVSQRKKTKKKYLFYCLLIVSK